MGTKYEILEAILVTNILFEKLKFENGVMPLN